MDRLLLVCLAGGIGSGMRYLVVAWTERVFRTPFSLGVLGVNLAVYFLIAMIAVLSLSKAGISDTMRITLTTGFLGGLTTYSTFSQETLTLLERRAFGAALVYVAATLFGCLLAGVAGAALARRI